MGFHWLTEEVAKLSRPKTLASVVNLNNARQAVFNLAYEILQVCNSPLFKPILVLWRKITQAIEATFANRLEKGGRHFCRAGVQGHL